MRKTSTDATHRFDGFRRLSRPQVVWSALAASVVVFGGLLLLVENRAIPGSVSTPLVELTSSGERADLDAILHTRRPIDRDLWRGIVIHHSAAPAGSADSITREHLARGFAGLGYHFIIGNGQGMGDGEIHVGYRWLEQLPGAHVAGPLSDQLNRQTIGVCLIGDGDRRPFTSRQLASLAELSALLSWRLDISDAQILLGRDVSPTSGPGRLFPEAAFRERLAVGE